MTSQPFTQMYADRQDAILTECGVSMPFIPHMKESGHTHPEVMFYSALWDTGANHTVVSHRVVDDLGLPVVAYNENYTAGGKVIVTNHLVNIVLPNRIEISSLLVSCCDLDDVDILLGMDVVTMGDFVITNKGGRTVFSFQIPSNATIDFCTEKNIN